MREKIIYSAIKILNKSYINTIERMMRKYK